MSGEERRKPDTFAVAATHVLILEVGKCRAGLYKIYIPNGKSGKCFSGKNRLLRSVLINNLTALLYF
jgi:hypothetical protein